MYCYIGLGNPGKEYENTRHNAGRMALFLFQKKSNYSEFAENKKFLSLVSDGKTGKEKIALALPETMMNASGKAVGALASFYKVKPDHVVVVHDDADIEFGRMKLSFAKSSAGHRGVESVKRSLKTEKFWRIRIGIQPSMKKHIPAMDLVLRKFKPSEEQTLKKVLKKVSETLRIIAEEGPERAMNMCN